VFWNKGCAERSFHHLGQTLDFVSHFNSSAPSHFTSLTRRIEQACLSQLHTDCLLPFSIDNAKVTNTSIRVADRKLFSLEVDASNISINLQEAVTGNHKIQVKCSTLFYVFPCRHLNILK